MKMGVMKTDGISVRAFRINHPMWVKFGIGDLHVMLWAVCEFPVYWRLESRSFLLGANKLSICAVAVKPRDILKVKNAVVNPVCCLTDCAICSPVVLLRCSFRRCNATRSAVVMLPAARS